MKKLLEVKNCNVTLSGKPILKEISFEIKKGEHLAIIGPNGAGKSMMMRMLVGDGIYPLANEKKPPLIKIFGKDGWNIFDLRKKIGVVSGKITGDMVDAYANNVYEAVASGSKGTYGFPFKSEKKGLNKKNIDAAIELMEIKDILKRPVTHLSTGQLRRVMVARALSHKPEILFLDEPTAGLDIVTQRHFFDKIRKISKDVTIILITHHVEEIFPEVTHVMMIKDAKIFKFGPKEKALNSPNMSALFNDKVKIKKQNSGYYSAEIQ